MNRRGPFAVAASAVAFGVLQRTGATARRVAARSVRIDVLTASDAIVDEGLDILESSLSVEKHL